MENTELNFEVGNKVYFKTEKRPYKVRACNDRYVICTKPFNLQHTVLYTIIDLERNVRGRENLIFCMGFETDELCHEAMCRLVSEETEVSWKYYIPLDVEKINKS